MEDDTMHQLAFADLNIDSENLDNSDSETTDLDKSEQQIMMAKIGEEDINEELMKAFQILDYDNDGKISAGDIKRICEELGESLTDAEIQEIIKAADLDSDGEISFDEFIRMTSGTSSNGY